MRRRWLVLAVVLLLLCAATPAMAAAKEISGECRFLVSEGSASGIYDSPMSTAWTPKKKNAEMRMMLPKGGAAYIQINWSIPPKNYTVTEYNAKQEKIATHSAAEDSFACISQLLPLNEKTRYVFINFSQAKQGINKVRVYTKGKLPATVVNWEPPHEKCDLLVVSTHEDDEWLWFGAIIPYYDLVKDKKVQVVYMANCGRLRYGEALNSLAVSGVRTYPMFVGLPDKRDSSLAASLKTWKSKDYILDVMVRIIRRFKPEVILTHDWDGEYGHPQHKLTSRCMEYAIEAAADPKQYPKSASKYGAWQVKKLYRHLEKKGRIEFDWHVAYPEFGGRTGIQVATDSMNQHASQLKYYQVEDHGKYDNALFGLSYSTVGKDKLHEDLFENIPESTAEPSPEPTLEATVEPAAEVAAEVTAWPSERPAQAESAAQAAEAEVTRAPEPTAEPAVTAAPQPVKERGSAAVPVAIGLGAAAAAGGAALALRARARARRRRRRGRSRGQGAARRNR